MFDRKRPGVCSSAPRGRGGGTAVGDSEKDPAAKFIARSRQAGGVFLFQISKGVREMESLTSWGGVPDPVIETKKALPIPGRTASS